MQHKSTSFSRWKKLGLLLFIIATKKVIHQRYVPFLSFSSQCNYWMIMMEDFVGVWDDLKNFKLFLRKIFDHKKTFLSFVSQVKCEVWTRKLLRLWLKKHLKRINYKLDLFRIRIEVVVKCIIDDWSLFYEDGTTISGNSSE